MICVRGFGAFSAFFAAIGLIALYVSGASRVIGVECSAILYVSGGFWGKSAYSSVFGLPNRFEYVRMRAI